MIMPNSFLVGLDEMQFSSLEIGIEYTRQDACALVSQTFLDTHLIPQYGSSLPPVVPLRIIREGHNDVYVGCLTQRAHHTQKKKILLSYTVADDLGLVEGQIIECLPLRTAVQAVKVMASPLTVDESEVMEQNALRIEHLLLRQVQVVFRGMRITVSIYPGVQARLEVQEIQAAEGATVHDGCAMMGEGTHFVIATRARPPSQLLSAGEPIPCWAVLRGLPPDSIAHPTVSTQMAVAKVCDTVAARYHWKNGGILSVLDLGCMAEHTEVKVTPSFLRSRTVNAVVEIDDRVQDAVCHCGWLSQSTNVLLMPDSRGITPNTEVSERRTAALTPVPSADKCIAMSDLEKVHGSVPRELLSYLQFFFSQPLGGDGEVTGGNILLCGGSGYGKTAIVSSVIGQLAGVHVVVLGCVANQSFKAQLQQALVECILCAPAVLVLDNFDRIAPAQKEGTVESVSAATRATLEAALVRYTRTFSFSPQSLVAVIATCTSREAVHESLRSVVCFPFILTVNALTRNTRGALLEQLFPEAEKGAIDKMIALMDNYTPFDIIQVERRMSTVAGVSLVERAKIVVDTFTPLAHTGIKFLKGGTMPWRHIGGLSEAKKVLYDALVLPTKHPNLFAKLPLKTRSGILLYGPSGCGKTFILESLVCDEGLHCIVVNGPEVFGKYIGQSEQKIRDVFERAQAAAPCVVFFDEFDAVAPQRGADNSGVTDRVVNQLLCYLDGVEARKDVYVVAASSRPDLIDAALLRPGRLDKAVQCPIPNHEDRIAILESLLAKVFITFPQEELAAIAGATENWTPADLRAMVTTATMLANKRLIETMSATVSGSFSARSGPEDEAFVIASVGEGTTRDKVADAVRHLTPTLAVHCGSNAKEAREVTIDDVRQAVKTTRPSLTERDIQKQIRIHKLFSPGDAATPTQPGTKLTFR